MLEGSDVFCKLIADILDPLVFLIFSLGFLIFLWGLVEFINKSGSSGDTKQGKDHMLWGVIGMFIMISAYGILSLISNTFGLGISLSLSSSCSSPSTVQQVDWGNPYN